MPSHGLPHQTEVEAALLYVMRASLKPITAEQAYRLLAERFNLTPKQTSRKLKTEGRPEWQNLVRWAKMRLKDRGYLEAPTRGVWALTSLGRIELELDL